MSNYLFESWSDIFRTCLVGLGAYLALVFFLRLSGKRTLSKLNMFDFIVTVAFGSTLATIILSNKVSAVRGVTALALLVLLQFLMTFAEVRWSFFKG